jgi:hypothetical protein
MLILDNPDKESLMRILDNLDLVFERARMRVNARVDIAVAVYKLRLAGGMRDVI